MSDGFQQPLTLDELRGAQVEAIRAHAWSAVETLQKKIDATEREGVVDLERERRKRGG